MSYIAKSQTFTKQGRLVERGQFIEEGEVDFVEGKSEDHLLPAPDGVEGAAVVEISAIAPTGPNPTQPQQIPVGTVQTPGGYEHAGAKLVGEVTVPEKQRIEVVGIDPEDTTQEKVTEALAEADTKDKNLPNEGTEGTVADVTARIATLDAAGLDELEARENDREKPRKGVIDAIEARRAALEA